MSIGPELDRSSRAIQPAPAWFDSLYDVQFRTMARLPCGAVLRAPRRPSP